MKKNVMVFQNVSQNVVFSRFFNVLRKWFPKMLFFHTFFQCLAKMVSQNQWFFNVFRRKCSKTNGFSTLSSENAVKPMVFQRFRANRRRRRRADPRIRGPANDKQPRTTSNRERQATLKESLKESFTLGP